MRRGWSLIGIAMLVACGDGMSAADATSTGTSGATSADGGGTTSTTGSASQGEGSGGDGSGSSSGGASPPPLPDVWQPGVVLPTDEQPHPRGLLDRRGLIHTHTPYSHDACDGMPRDDQGNLDQQCVDDWRSAVCHVRHDFVMLTDHSVSFADSEYPDVLMYDESHGDVLLDDTGSPRANWAGCDGIAPGIPPTLVMAGCETQSMMPVALPEHAPGRDATYGSSTPEAIAQVRQTGAIALVAHTEDWTVDDLVGLPLDGFEMYNLHANLLLDLQPALLLLDKLHNDPSALPHPDLAIMPIFEERPEYIETWGSVLAQGVQRVTTVATDAHRNTFTDELADGERIDSFRRMMQWFSNHLLVDAGDDGIFDDRDLVAALGSGRLYAAFEYMGYPRGFDAYAQAGEAITEIGGTVSLADAPQLVATAPTVRRLDPDAPPPEITVHLLEAIDGGFDEVASGDDALTFTPTETGAYRVEVRMTPHHLKAYLAAYADLADQPRVWIYANPIYVTD